MHPLLRMSRSNTTTTGMLRSVYYLSSSNQTLTAHQSTTSAGIRRFYARQSGGGENPQGNRPVPASRKSRELEHPGPPPPNTSEVSQNTGAPLRIDEEAEQAEQAATERQRREQALKREPSNKAHPTLNVDQDEPSVDTEGHVRGGVSEDVTRHNREMQQRYDRAYNQIEDGGKVSRGFWKGGGGSLTEDKGGARRNGGH